MGGGSAQKDEHSQAYNRLHDFIQNCHALGKTREEIVDILTKVGWPGHILDHFFSDQTRIESPSVIRLEGITKRYRGNLVLDNISLDIGHGEVFGIIGVSGSGKTTLLNTMVGFLQPDEGHVLLKLPRMDEWQHINQNKKIKQLFGFATQNHSFYPLLTVRENLEHFGSLYGISRSEIKTNADSLLNFMELYPYEDSLSRDISGGMQKRLGISCALIHSPDVVILDEPTADLDPFLRREIANLIRNINKQGTTVILTSHLFQEIETLCTQIGILHKGIFQEVGTAEHLRSLCSKKKEIHIQTEPGHYDYIIDQIEHKHIAQKTSVIDNKLVIKAPDPEHTLHYLLHVIEKSNEKLLEVEVRKPSLIDVFESLTKSKKEPEQETDIFI
ncbi:MAG: ABC transporter ATP-binding protein [archaeon]